MIQRSFKRIMKIKAFHEKHGIPYRAIVQNESMTIISDLHQVRNKSDFPSDELWFIAAVKEAIIKGNLHKDIRNIFKKEGSQRKIKYFYYNKRFNPGDMLENCYEVDMKSAYFEMAYKLGLIPEHLYKRCVSPVAPKKPISKSTRLAAIGSLARKRYVIEFDGKKQIPFPVERQDETEYLWDTICYRVGKIMARIAKRAGKDFVFFWVDALFIKGDSLELVKSLFKKEGFEFSVDQVKKISFEKKNIIVRGKLVKRRLSEAAKERISEARKELFGTETMPEDAISKLHDHLQQQGFTMLPEAIQAGLRGQKFYRTEIRPFPYNKSMNEAEVLELASQNNE